ncbi:MAG: UDP-N-acetylmuramoylalanine-D-glutamate ligase, partial [Candidatus Roizmanbacteria bacterium GW2011_GWC2_35_12]
MNEKLIDELRQKYEGKKVLVVGLGLQMGGVGLAKFFNELGAKVIVTDKKTPEQLRASVELLKNYP